MERNEEFVFETLASIRNNEALLARMLLEAKKIRSGDGRILQNHDFYTNKKEDALYHVMKVHEDSRGVSKVEVEILFSSNPKTKGERTVDFITGKLFDQEVHVLAISRAL